LTYQFPAFATDIVAIGKARAACAQSFAPWQQATTEFTRRDHSIIACSRHVYILLLFAHIPFVGNHTFNATPPERLQQYNKEYKTYIGSQTGKSKIFILLK